jgi:hypothetical protein
MIHHLTCSAICVSFPDWVILRTGSDETRVLQCQLTPASCFFLKDENNPFSESFQQRERLEKQRMQLQQQLEQQQRPIDHPIVGELAGRCCKIKFIKPGFVFVKLGP